MKGSLKVANELQERGPDMGTAVPQCLETSLWETRGGGVAVQSEVVNQNESRGLGEHKHQYSSDNTTEV